MISERLESLQAVMKQRGIDVYLVPSEDFHQSEYVGEYFKARAFLTGFTGSAGTVVVTQDEACLWTDGRYFLQAEKQSQGSPIVLQRMGQPGVPAVEEYIQEKLPEGGKLGFDGRVISVFDGKNYEQLAESKRASIVFEEDLIDAIWKDRPPFSQKEAFFLSEEYSGESAASKISRIRDFMQEKGADLHIISSLDDNCWTFNIRGDDILYSPLVLCYSIIGKENITLFVDEHKLTDEILNSFEGLNIAVKPYNAIYEAVKELDTDQTVLLDPNKMNYALYTSIPKGMATVEERNPAIVFKAIKNDTEVSNFIEAHRKDGVAWTKFMHWLKHNIGKTEIDEIAASDKLEAFRKEQTGYLWPSFAPISGYGENAAIVHYGATEESSIPLQPRGLYLSDTGSNFMEGSTDVTRTVALGELTEEEKFHFTLVLKSHIQLAAANFPHGTSGYALDTFARAPFWERNLDFNHGTGHGLGYLLNIHEAPSGFRYKINPMRDESYPLQPNMILTIEPGIYIAGSHGIRTENCVVVRRGEENEYGNFLYFEPITMVPIDLDAIDASMLTQQEKDYLNRYHDQVFEIIAPHLEPEEAEWLKEYTQKI